MGDRTNFSNLSTYYDPLSYFSSFEALVSEKVIKQIAISVFE